MMEAIAIEVLGAGGKAHILTTTDGERRYRAEQLPLQYLGAPPSSIDSALILQSDLEINLPYDSDFRSIWPHLGSERFKRHQRSNPILSELNERSTRRYLYLAMPSQPEVVAAIKGVGWIRPPTRHSGGEPQRPTSTAWRSEVLHSGSGLRARRRSRHHPDGTDFTFTPSDRPVHVDVAAMSRVASRGQPWTRRQASFPPARSR